MVEFRISKEEEEILKSLPFELDREKLKELKIIAQIVGGDFGMEVKLGQPGKGSFFDSEKREITLDPLHLKEKDYEARFVAAHEGGHRAITRGPDAIGLKPEARDKIYGEEIGFAYTANCLEDPVDNDWVVGRYPGLQPDFQRSYSEMLQEEGKPLGLTHPDVLRIIRRTGTIPNLVWYGSEIIRYWHTKKFSKGLKEKRPEVLEALAKTLRPAIKTMKTLPAKYASEGEIVEKARERFSTTYNDVWPEAKKLVEEDLKNDSLRQMVEDFLKKLAEEKGAEEAADDLENGQSGTPLDQIPKEMRKKLGEALKKGQEKLAEEQNKEREELEGFPLSMDEMDGDLKKELEKQFKKLPKEKQEELKKRAEEQLKELEDKLNEAMNPKLNQDNPDSHQKYDERHRQKRDEEKREKEKEKEAGEIKKKVEQAFENLKTDYDKYYEEVVDIIDELYRRLEEVFIRERHPRWRKGYPAGGKLNMLKAMQFEQQREAGVELTAARELFEQKTLPKRFDYRFTLLVDLSESMYEEQGEKIKETFKGLVVLSEVLNRLGIQFEVIGFASTFSKNHFVYKSFDDEFHEEKRQGLVEMLSKRESATPTGAATEIASRRLEENKGKENFLITLTDGQPYNDPRDLKKVIKKIREETEQKLIGLGLGPDTENVVEYYPSALPNIKAKDLPEIFAALIEDIILNPEKYS